MKKKRVVGLDASTTTIGFSVVDYDGYSGPELKHVEHFKPPKKGDLFEKLDKVREFIFDRLDKYKPDDVALEDIILFMKGHSTAKTISSLAVLNRTVGLAVYNKTGKPPQLLNVMKIRHAIKENKKLPAKEDIPELVAKILNIKFPYILNKKGAVAVENYDRADSIAVALAYIENRKRVEKPAKKRTKKQKSKKIP
ncbi:MAG TPA: crossover junction endodeoxyribonuclease RuvC [Anaerovoracaceae bacterium]|nr:crossover junction endodeoxyribonuclease RuvC [Anaerovoracaceae bacterium]